MPADGSVGGVCHSPVPLSTGPLPSPLPHSDRGDHTQVSSAGCPLSGSDSQLVRPIDGAAARAVTSRELSHWEGCHTRRAVTSRELSHPEGRHIGRAVTRGCQHEGYGVTLTCAQISILIVRGSTVLTSHELSWWLGFLYLIVWMSGSRSRVLHRRM